MPVICKMPSSGGKADKNKYILRNGVINTSFVGGYESTAYISPTDTMDRGVAPNVAFSDGKMKLSIARYSTSYHGRGTVFFSNVVDCTNFNKLKVEFEPFDNTQVHFLLQITPTKANNYTRTAYTIVSYSVTSGVAELDISSISGSYYVSISPTQTTGKTNTATYSLKNIWLEPKEKVKPVNLYNYGDECTSVTGGWVGSAKQYSNQYFTGVLPTITKSSDHITAILYGQGKSISTYFSPANKIDLTNYSKLVFRITGSIPKVTYNQLHFIVCEQIAGLETTPVSTYGVFADNEGTANDKLSYSEITELTVDVSGITGSYYVGFAFCVNISTTASMKFELNLYSMHLE